MDASASPYHWSQEGPSPQQNCVMDPTAYFYSNFMVILDERQPGQSPPGGVLSGHPVVPLATLVVALQIFLMMIPQFF